MIFVMCSRSISLRMNHSLSLCGAASADAAAIFLCLCRYAGSMHTAATVSASSTLLRCSFTCVVSSECDSHLIGHFARLRSVPQFSEAQLVIFIEHQGDFVRANRYAEMLKRSIGHRVMIPSADTKDLMRPGVPTTNATKEDGTGLLQTILDDNALHFGDPFVATDPAKLKEELISQMKNYKRQVKRPTDMVYGKYRSTLSGKSATGSQDDLVTALHQGVMRAVEHEESRGYGMV